ncbi:hypothetical protein N0V90_003092 [Kalmusia sp. IMI 367209]|nr:hypothetical protein N0V90_003092 [Kalmusia sp. IMI 367209]
MATRSLCEKCQQFPLDILLYGPYDRKLTRRFFRFLHEVWTAENCRLCLFMKTLLAAHYGEQYIISKLGQGYDQELWMYRNALDLTFNEYEATSHATAKIPFCLQVSCYTLEKFRSDPAAIFRRESRKRDDDQTRDWVMPSIFALKQISERPSFDTTNQVSEGIFVEQPGRLVDDRKIEWENVKEWDSACAHHAWSQSESQLASDSEADYRSRLRVIDVDRACVMPCPLNARYVALSYQWGSDQKLKLKKENIAMLETPGFFKSPSGQPAQTIQDAIETVRQLGYKYAWIDALCIVQDDGDNVTMNVDQMDQIYRGAHLTIVAAAGKDAYYGLPGVSSTTPRPEKQLRAVIKGIEIASMLETGQGAINFSRWMTRAWTWVGWDAAVVYELVDSMNNACECVMSQATITLPNTNHLLTSEVVSRPAIPRDWHRHFDDEELTIHYQSTDPAFSHYRYPRPLPRMTVQKNQSMLQSSAVLKVTARTATFILTDQHSLLRDSHTREKAPCREGHHELCYLAILDDQKRTAGTIIVSGDLLPLLADRKHKFLGLSRSTLSRIDDDPSWDPDTKTFRFWSEQLARPPVRETLESQAFVDEASQRPKFDWSRGDDEDDDEVFKKNFIPPNDDFFDNRHFSDQVYWPAMNVLLLSEEKDGVVERMGVGKIHVDAFEPIARYEELLLG